MLENIFKLKERGTDVKTEIMAGVTTFITMAYILFVAPSILSVTGMEKDAALLATAIGAGVVSIAMGLFVNYPIALAPGMGLIAFYSFTVCVGMGIKYPVALGAVFISGIIFILLTLGKVRQLLVDAMPQSLKKAITVGIGLFITIIGLKLSGLMTIRLSLSPESLTKLAGAGGNGVPGGSETIIELGHLVNPEILLSLLGLVLIGILSARGIKGAILWSILITTLVAIVTGVVKVPANFTPVAVPNFANNAFFVLDIPGAWAMGLLTIIFTFTFVDLFDTMGTLVGTATRAGLTDKNGKFPGIGKAMFVDASGVSLGALLGSSPITAYIESAAGVGAGGRTGITAVTAGVLFLLALFFSPLVGLIPTAATAPALIFVGALMLSAVRDIDFNDVTEYLPAFLTIVFMPFTYSIANGISVGLVFYPLLKLIKGEGKNVHPVMYILAVLVIARFLFLK